MASAPMGSVRTISGNQPEIARVAEEIAQVFLLGTPVMVAADGGIQAWDGETVVNGIAGISKVAASNLNGTGVAKLLTFGSVPNEALAVNIARGAPFNDGRVDFETSVADTVFYGQVGPAQATLATDVSKQYGMTQDADGHWYVDKNKSGNQAVVQIVELDYNDTARGVHFKFLASAYQAA